MNLDNYVVISGLPGVHKLVTSRSNGLIIEDKVENRTRFVPVRTSQLTPLATIGIYTETEEGTVALATVFRKMYDQRETTPVVSPDAGSANLRTYFTTILPEHDQYRVHINDIKKCVKWYSFMESKGMIDEAIKIAAEKEAAAKVEESTSEKA